MAKQVRYFTQIVDHLNREFGQEKSEAIMANALQRYDELLEENKDEAKECYMHTRERIYPVIACFDALLSEGVERKKAADFIVDYYKWRSGKLAPFIKKAFKILGLYRIVPKFFMGMTEKSFGPKAGFASKDHFVSKDEVRFNMTKCPYFDKCKQYGLPLMKKIVPFGFKKGSGVGWRYTWHEDDPKNEFRFECNECIYAKILGRRNLLKLGTMCCHADIINYGALPFTDFIRTKTLCHGGEYCDFRFVRHDSDAGEGWSRYKSI